LKTTNAVAPSFKFPPHSRNKLNKARLFIDIAGLAAVYTFGSLAPAKYQWILSIYSICAWITILTIDPSRLPEAATTRKKQSAAWNYFIKLLPLFAAALAMAVHWDNLNRLIHPASIGFMIGLLLNAMLYEVYFRNILQVYFRKWGLPAFLAILAQSLLFAFGFYVKGHSIPAILGIYAIGLLTGFICYKTRSSLANIAVMAVVFWIFAG
jgi:membrane protease YdiL (CAAX protease family)